MPIPNCQALLIVWQLITEIHVQSQTLNHRDANWLEIQGKMG